MDKKICDVDILGNINTVFGCSFTHVFSFYVSDSFAFEFSLPENTAISEIYVSLDDNEIGGFTAGQDKGDMSGFTLNKNKDNNYLLICDISYSGLVKIKVRSISLLSLRKGCSDITVPIVTKIGHDVREKNERQMIEDYGVKTHLKFIIDEPSVRYASSLTHSVDCISSENGLVLEAEGDSLDDFSLRLDYGDSFMSENREQKNIAYISKPKNHDMTGVYVFSPKTLFKRQSTDYLFVFFVKGDSASKRRMAVAAITDLIKNLDDLSSAYVMHADSKVYEDKAQRRMNIDYEKLSEWLYGSEKIFDKHSAEKVLEKIENFPQREVVFVSDTDMTDVLNGIKNRRIHLIDFSENTDSIALRKAISSCGGVYSAVSLKDDYKRFIKGLCERLYGGRLIELKIKEYSLGTYFNMPKKINTYNLDDVIIYTCRSNGDYPKQLILEADGGFYEEIDFDEVICLSENECESVFGQMALSVIYTYISRGDIAPEAIVDLKIQAERISSECNILCPENIAPPWYKSPSVPKINSMIHMINNDKYGDDVSVFSDTKERKEELVRLGVYALLCYIRSDYHFTLPYQGLTNEMMTVYAAMAIENAANNGFLDDKEGYISLAKGAMMSVSKLSVYKKAINNTQNNLSPMVPKMHHLKNAIENDDIIEISRIILDAMNGIG